MELLKRKFNLHILYIEELLFENDVWDQLDATIMIY